MNESILHFGPDRRLIGVLTVPEKSRSENTPAVVFLNAGIIHRVGPNRIHVRLCRMLAEAGIPSFRFDLPGVGDSLPLNTSGSVEADHVQSVGFALDALEAQGVSSRFVLYGLCSGAMLGFRLTYEDPRVVGLVFLDPPRLLRTWRFHQVRALQILRRPRVWVKLVLGRYGVIRYLRGWAASAWEGLRGSGVGPRDRDLKKEAEEALRLMVSRDVKLLLIVTGSMSDQYNYQNQFLDAFSAVDLRRILRIGFFPQFEHQFPRESSRRKLMAEVLDWYESSPFGMGRPAGR